MNAVRARLASAFEWGVAAAFLVATLAVSSLIVHELWSVTAVPPPRAEEPTPPPPGVPARAIAVPILLLLDGKEIRVGDSAARVAALLGDGAELTQPAVDRGALGARLTRYYEHAGTRFILVFEPFERGGEPRVASIHLH